MKYLVIFAFLIAPIVAEACNGPNRTCISQRNTANNTTAAVPIPVPSSDAVYFFEFSTLLPKAATLGPNCSFTSGVFNCSGGGGVNADWNANSGLSQILNKPSLSTVATTGSYGDLSDKPVIPSAQVNSDWSSASGVSQILNKPSLALVATSGNYNDLFGKPTIPAAQVNADWSSVSGPSQILNKPALFSGAYSSLTGIPASFVPSAHTHSWADIVSGKPTTLAGYGIMDAATGAALSSGLATKFNVPTGSATQCLRGDGSVGVCPVTSTTTSAPTQRSVSLSTAYQCTDTARPCMVTATMTCPLTLSLLAGATCAGEFRIGSANNVATGGGTNIAPIQRNASGILGLSTNDYETNTVKVPVGWFFAIRQTTGSGMSIISVFDQAD